jgi:hypothetical protein
MAKRIERDPNTGKRVLRFVATSAVVVAPISMAACGGAGGVPEASNVDHHEEHTNVDHTDEVHANPGPEEEAVETTNVDHTAEPHTNVGPEEEGAEEGGGDEESPE